ncbi:MAG: NAD(P)-dependent oxidoreductase [Candidatus Pacebacteria bacterium]|nr:NAD(P)-dependent oxidoreductase [Candidatus Paceibacterota bacterium]
MKITYFYNEEWETSYVKDKLAGHEITFLKGSLDDYPDLRDESAEVLSVFVNSKVGKAELDRFPNLKNIAARSTGYDNVDVEEASKRGISVSFVPAYGANTVAEFAFGLLLTVSRKLYECIKKVQDEGLFSQEGLRGFDLRGKTMGVVGTGNIGMHMIQIAKGFGMNVLAFDAYPKENMTAELGFRYTSFDEILAKSDVVSMHLPYMKETHHILNSENIGKMKKGSILINTARGALVETNAIVKGLREGILIGVGLDVLEEEGYIEDETKLFFAPHPNEESLKTTLANHYLIEHPRAIISPHNAFNTDEAIRRILDTSAENILSFSFGKPKNIVIQKK